MKILITGVISRQWLAASEAGKIASATKIDATRVNEIFSKCGEGQGMKDQAIHAVLLSRAGMANRVILLDRAGREVGSAFLAGAM